MGVTLTLNVKRTHAQEWGFGFGGGGAFHDQSHARTRGDSELLWPEPPCPRSSLQEGALNRTGCCQLVEALSLCREAVRDKIVWAGSRLSMSPLRQVLPPPTSDRDLSRQSVHVVFLVYSIGLRATYKQNTPIHRINLRG